MPLDPTQQPDEQPKPEATYCPNCARFEMPDDVVYMPSWNLMEMFEITNKYCPNNCE